MLSYETKQLLDKTIGDIIIPAEKVAHVQVGNSLEHALLVLTKCGYSAIPVLDSQFRFHGLISSALITEKILGLERIEFEKLEVLKVEEVMTTKVPTVKTNTTFLKVLELLVDHPFLITTDNEGFFEGILTRRAIMKPLSGHIHKLLHTTV